MNFTNPVGIVMQALHDHSSVRAVGICDGPISMQRSVAEFLDLPRERVHADYFGLNHCGWIHRVLVDGTDRLPELLDRFEELQAADEQWRLFEPGLVRAIGMLPDGVPLLLLLPGPGGRAHPRLGRAREGGNCRC